MSVETDRDEGGQVAQGWSSRLGDQPGNRVDCCCFACGWNGTTHERDPWCPTCGTPVTYPHHLTQRPKRETA